jgi:transposase
MRLAQVADYYRTYVAAGTSNPSSAVAERFDVNPSTARAWIHRARQKGYLGPARGPTPGEESPADDRGTERKGKR